MHGVRDQDRVTSWTLILLDALRPGGPIATPRSDPLPATELHEPTDRRVRAHLLKQIPRQHRDAMFHQGEDLLNRPRRN
jgi:hypothetical protein